MTLQEAVAVLMGHSNRQEVKDLLHREAHPLAQMFIDQGHGIASETFKAERKTLTDAKEAAERERDQLRTENETLKKDKPDLAQMQRDHQVELDKIKADAKKDVQKEKEKNKAHLRQRDQAAIESKLVAKGVKPLLAKLMAKDPDVLARLDHDEEGNVTVFKAGSKIPLTAADGQSPLDLLVGELDGQVQAEDRSAGPVDQGSDLNKDRNNGAGGSGGQNRFDKIRAEEEEKNKAGEAGTAQIRNKKFGSAV